MAYYTIQENNLLMADKEESLTRFYDNVLPLPVDYEENKYIVQNNELILNPDWDSIHLESVKEEKIQENDTLRDEALNQGVTYKDVLFDSDTDQKANLLGAVLQMGDTGTVVWFGMNNDSLTCTKEDLLNIGGLITQLQSFCWTKNAEIKSEISEAQTVEAVEEIEIDYTLGG